MEQYNNENISEDIPAADNPPQQPEAPEREGGIFGEQSFAGQPQPSQPMPDYRYAQQYAPQQNMQQYHYQNAYNYQQQYRPDPDNQYRQMYSGGYYGYQPVPQPAYNPPPPPPADVVPPVSEASGNENKKGSKAWVAVLIVGVLLLVGAVIAVLALSHDGKADDSVQSDVSYSAKPSGDNITVNISVTPKPVEEEQYYQNKETGLLTPAGAAKQILPSIVNLYGYTTNSITPYNEASGVIISEDGYIITNAHAVEDISRVKAKLYDEREFEAEIIGIDTKTDLAVIKIQAENLVPAVLGDSDDLVQGEEVIAVGNAGGFNDTVTVGYVSHTDREIDSYTGYPIKCIQTDAALNFGNSGGALVNLYGQVVGIVTSKYSSTGAENIGFAIATDFAVPIAEDLIKMGFVEGRPRIGITYLQMTPENAKKYEVKPGLMVAEISSDCDISNTELQKDDIITELDGQQMLTEADVKEFQNSHKAGDTVTARVYRKSLTGEKSEFEITFKLEQDKNLK